MPNVRQRYAFNKSRRLVKSVGIAIRSRIDWHLTSIRSRNSRTGFQARWMSCVFFGNGLPPHKVFPTATFYQKSSDFSGHAFSAGHWLQKNDGFSAPRFAEGSIVTYSFLAQTNATIARSLLSPVASGFTFRSDGSFRLFDYFLP